MIGQWIEQALCRRDGSNPDWWWPEGAEDRTAVYALAICARCPVQAPCRDYALSKPEEFGIWGGTMPETRRRARALQQERHAGPGVVGLSLARHTDNPAEIARRRQLLREIAS